jgi:predicted acyltransferase
MQQRYYSLDVFRGATVALMILVNNPGSWSHVFPPLSHAEWHGCTPTDLVFPFFLFAVGNALAFTLDRYKAMTTPRFLMKVGQRALLLILIGIFLSWSPFVKWDQDELIVKPWEQVRILGVLQRIGITFFLAALLLYLFKPAWAMAWGGFLLILYWGLCMGLGDPADPYSATGYFGQSIDAQLLGKNHLYKAGTIVDPEGLMSTLSAIVQVMIGYYVGDWIRQGGKNYEMLSRLFFIGTLLTLTGLMWDQVFPINKKIWTGSYTLYTSGLATLTICCMIYLLEFREAKGAWSQFFDAFGKNPLFIFVLSGFLPRLLGLIRIESGRTNDQGEPIYLSPFSWLYENLFKHWGNDLRIGSFAYAVFLIFVYWLIVYWMDKRKIYIRV